MVIDKKEEHTYLINIAILNDKNVVEKEEKKRGKYTLLAMEVKELWQQEKVTIILLVTSVTGITSKNYTENLQKLAYQNTSTPMSRKQSYLKYAQLSGNS